MLLGGAGLFSAVITALVLTGFDAASRCIPTLVGITVLLAFDAQSARRGSLTDF